jgi:hypothetical protein
MREEMILKLLSPSILEGWAIPLYHFDGGANSPVGNPKRKV